MLIKELGLFSGFYLTNNFLENYFNKKNARNIVSGSHAFICVLLNSGYLITGYPLLNTISHNFSSGFFIYDIYYILRNGNLNFLKYCYLYHHAAAIYLIKNSYLVGNFNLILFTAELSNLPSYIVYHNMNKNIKTQKTEENIKYYKKIQKVLYGLIRAPYMTYLLTDTLLSMNFNNSSSYYLLFTSLPVYLMGLGWTFKLLTE